MDADAAGNTVIYMVPNYQIDGKTGTWLPYDSEVVRVFAFFMMRNVITQTTMLYYGQLFVKNFKDYEGVVQLDMRSDLW